MSSLLASVYLISSFKAASDYDITQLIEKETSGNGEDGASTLDNSQ